VQIWCLLCLLRLFWMLIPYFRFNMSPMQERQWSDHCPCIVSHVYRSQLWHSHTRLVRCRAWCLFLYFFFFFASPSSVKLTPQSIPKFRSLFFGKGVVALILLFLLRICSCVNLFVTVNCVRRQYRTRVVRQFPAEEQDRVGFYGIPYGNLCWTNYHCYRLFSQYFCFPV
jgi:hypothetical protein